MYDETRFFQGTVPGEYTKKEIKDALVSTGMLSRYIDSIVVDVIRVNPDDSMGYEVTVVWLHLATTLSVPYLATKWAECFF